MSIQDLQTLVRKYATSKSWKIGWHNKKKMCVLLSWWCFKLKRNISRVKKEFNVTKDWYIIDYKNYRNYDFK